MHSVERGILCPRLWCLGGEVRMMSIWGMHIGHARGLGWGVQGYGEWRCVEDLAEGLALWGGNETKGDKQCCV